MRPESVTPRRLSHSSLSIWVISASRGTWRAPVEPCGLVGRDRLPWTLSPKTRAEIRCPTTRGRSAPKYLCGVVSALGRVSSSHLDEGELIIRPYEPRDRLRVRRICYLTGYKGDPAEWYWRDSESFADLFTSYYTDAEPESAFVAELGGVVAGYLLGCVDTAKSWDPSKIFFHHGLRRGIAFRRGTAGVVWRSIGDVAIEALHRRPPPVPFRDARWPSHLHIDLLASIRGRGVGRALMRRWIAVLDDLGSPGCHVETLGENHRAIALFESSGFRRHGTPSLAPGLRSPTGTKHTIQILVRSRET
jgi:ribosomal protein S18 acetylase RimI-like enzyme